MNSLKEVAKIIKKSKSIALFTHISPDFDALGSSFTLYHGLKKLGKSVEIFIKEKLTPKQKMLFDESIINNKRCQRENFDLFVCTDVSVITRLGDYAKIYENKKDTVVIDHHICNEDVGQYNYIDSSRSSCSEIVFDLLKLLKVKIDSQMASYLYAGLSSDTASFLNSNTNAMSLLAGYEIVKLGADIHKINQLIYESRTLKDIEFKKISLEQLQNQERLRLYLGRQ